MPRVRVYPLLPTARGHAHCSWATQILTLNMKVAAKANLHDKARRGDVSTVSHGRGSKQQADCRNLRVCTQQQQQHNQQQQHQTTPEDEED